MATHWSRMSVTLVLIISSIAFAVTSSATDLPSDDAVQIQNRLAYGPTPADTAVIDGSGYDVWLSRNLYLHRIVVPQRLITLRDTLTLPIYNRQVSPDNQINEISNLQVVQALYSPWQLQEQLTNFWEQHFNTNYRKIRQYFRQRFFSGDLTKGSQVAAYFDWLENSYFRGGSLGKFEDLLITSATGPAMMVYLDTALSTAGNPNENFGRELLELYTVGVANHTQEDVLAAAKIFTGLEIKRVHPDDYGNPFSRQISTDDARALGDVDYSSVVDSVDETLVSDAIAGGVYDPQFDVNGDGVLDSADLDIVIANLDTISWVLGLWYDPDDYVPGPKTFFRDTPHEFTLGIHLVNPPTPEMKWGETIELLDRLAGLPMTAEYVSAKLLAKFVMPLDPDDLGNVSKEVRDLLDRCMAIWQSTDGHLRSVLSEIARDPLFFKSGPFIKTETPFESAVSTIRAFESADTDVGAVTTRGRVNSIRFWIEKRSFHSFFMVGPPTGFPEESPPGSGNLLGRMKRNEVTFTGGGNARMLFDWQNVVTPQPPSQSDLLAMDILTLLYGPRGTRAQMVQVAFDFLDDMIAADPTITHGEMCDGLAAMVSSYPRGFMQ